MKKKFTIKECKISRDFYERHKEIYAMFHDNEKCPRYRLDDDTLTVLSDEGPTCNLSCSMCFVPRVEKEEQKKFRWRACVDVERKGSRGRVGDFNSIVKWALAAAKRNGFSVELSQVSTPYTILMKKPGVSPYVYNVVDFKGTLTVIDEVKCNEALQNGIGQGKYAGLGLVDILEF